MQIIQNESNLNMATASENIFVVCYPHLNQFYDYFPKYVQIGDMNIVRY